MGFLSLTDSQYDFDDGQEKVYKQGLYHSKLVILMEKLYITKKHKVA